jgi:hypothetical protein
MNELAGLIKEKIEEEGLSNVQIEPEELKGPNGEDYNSVIVSVKPKVILAAAPSSGLRLFN